MTETKQTLIRVAPSSISYSQKSISPVFRSIYSTLHAVWIGALDVEEVDPIQVFIADDHQRTMCSLDNRRLWVWKQLEQTRSQFLVPVLVSSEPPPKHKKTAYSQVIIRCVPCGAKLKLSQRRSS
jgi:hypothetical protein